MKLLLPGLLTASLLVLAPSGASAKCGDNVGDNAAVAAARGQVEADCPCPSFTKHGEYVKCAKTVANDRVDAMLLPKNCKGSVVKCAAKSTCGKPGFVTCCRTNSKGKTKCSTKKDASKCKVPKGGSACVGTLPSCCDACTAGCVPPPTPTPTPTPAPTATPAPPTPTPTPAYGSPNQAFIQQSGGLFQ